MFFRACYFQNEVGDPPFFYISDIAKSWSFNSTIFKKKSMLEKFRANVLYTAQTQFEIFPRSTESSGNCAIAMTTNTKNEASGHE